MISMFLTWLQDASEFMILDCDFLSNKHDFTWLQDASDFVFVELWIFKPLNCNH